MSKFIIPLSLLVCLILNSTVISAHDGGVSSPSSSSLSGSALIKKACQGNTQCVSTLECAPENQKEDAHGLIFFALRSAGDLSKDFTEGITAFMDKPDQVPMAEQVYIDCIHQMEPVGDLIKDATNAAFSGEYPDAIKFVEAAAADVGTCSEMLKNRITEKIDPELGVDRMIAESAPLRITFSAVLNLLKA